MSDNEVVAAIRARHLKANIAWYEAHPERYTLHWDRAFVDRGGTIFGLGPYVKLPITVHEPNFSDEITIRVYAPERLRKRLAVAWVGGEKE
jgi:hypothetical protein